MAGTPARLRTRAPAFIRRQRCLLEWIDRHHADAVVRWRGRDIGTWKSAKIGWQVSGAKVRVSFQGPARKLAGTLAALEIGSDGALLRLRSSAGESLDSLRATWVDEPCGQMRESEESHRRSVRDWLRRQLPGCKVLRSVCRSDLARSLSGSYLRIHARSGGTDHLVLACPGEGIDENPGPMLTQGILWLSALEDQGRLLAAHPVIHLLGPPAGTQVLRHRAGLLDPSRCVFRVWDSESGTGDPWSRCLSDPAQPVEERDFTWPVTGPFRWSPLLSKVVSLAPGVIRRHPRLREFDSLRINGLEFARVSGENRDRIFFGVGGAMTELSEENFDSLTSLVEAILYFRRPDSPDPQHPFYRRQAERWLECLIMEEVSHLFPELAPEEVYSQIPVYLGEEQGRVDILAVDRIGTPVVMEIKVSEDPDLPMQALDYWGRVVQHNLRGDFERRGYFTTVGIRRRPPRIYLVSPIFSFHDSLERILRRADPDLDVTKVAVNEDWRSGVQVLHYTKLECGEGGKRSRG